MEYLIVSCKKSLKYFSCDCPFYTIYFSPDLYFRKVTNSIYHEKNVP